MSAEDKKRWQIHATASYYDSVACKGSETQLTLGGSKPGISQTTDGDVGDQIPPLPWGHGSVYNLAPISPTSLGCSFFEERKRKRQVERKKRRKRRERRRDGEREGGRKAKKEK